MFIDNDAMASYREVSRYVSCAFLVLQNVLLIDFGYRLNEYLVDLDERSESESMCTWKLVLLFGSIGLYAVSITMWVFEGQWFGSGDCAPQQTIIAITILMSVALSVVSVTRIAPHGTLLTSAIVTSYASYQAYSALASHPDASCNATTHSGASDLLVGFMVFGVAMFSMVMSAWSATASKEAMGLGDQMVGKGSTSNSDLTVTLETGAASDDKPADDESGAVAPESWWYFNLMMVVVAMYMSMLLTGWSVQPVDASHQMPHPDVSLESFWIKTVAQWLCLLLYGWTLLAPYLLRNVRDFGVEFDFD